MDLPLADMADFFISHGSYFGIFVFMVLTGAGLPLPEEVAIIAAGVLCAHDQLHYPWLAFGALLAGGLVGDCVMYWVGHHFGRAVVREHRWWAHCVTPEREAKMEQLLHQHGLKVLFVARFLVGVRSPIYLSAGILRLPFKRFVLFDLLCATTVIALFFSVSYFFGEEITKWIFHAERAATVVVVLAVIVAGLYFWRRHRRKQAECAAEASAASASPDGPSDDEPASDDPASDDPQKSTGKVERVA